MDQGCHACRRLPHSLRHTPTHPITCLHRRPQIPAPCIQRSKPTGRTRCSHSSQPPLVEKSSCASALESMNTSQFVANWRHRPVTDLQTELPPSLQMFPSSRIASDFPTPRARQSGPFRPTTSLVCAEQSMMTHVRYEECFRAGINSNEP